MGPPGEACKGLGGVFLNQEQPHCPLHQQGAVGGNGQQGLWRLARAMESCWRHSSEHPWVHPGRTQAEVVPQQYRITTAVPVGRYGGYRWCTLR